MQIAPKALIPSFSGLQKNAPSPVSRPNHSYLDSPPDLEAAVTWKILTFFKMRVGNLKRDSFKLYRSIRMIET